MSYTNILNPAIDYYVALDKVELTKINRSHNEHIEIGCKGINVSTILNRLKCGKLCIRFCWWFIGNEIINYFKIIITKKSLPFLKGNTRINVKFNDGTEINSQGPIIHREDEDSLIYNLEKSIQKMIM